MFDLAGKNALITGATGGIGEAIAWALHERGATVSISGRQEQKLQALAGAIGERTHALPCDLADREAVGQLIDQATKAMGSVDILVNNAGMTKDNLFMVMKDDVLYHCEEWKTTRLALTICKQQVRPHQAHDEAEHPLSC